MPLIHPQVYPPREDTYLLLDAALQEIHPGDHVLEVGCGSGYIAAGLAEYARVLATDINPHAVRETRMRGVDVVRSDLLRGIRGPFDMVLFNPPYLPTSEDERMNDWLEHALDGGPDGCRVIAEFAAGVTQVLAPGGRVLLLFSSLTGPERVIDLFVKQGFECETCVEKNVEGETLSVIRCKVVLKKMDNKGNPVD